MYGQVGGEVFTQINAQRSTSLIRDPTLDKLAKAHSKWMSETRLLCHEGVTTRYVQMGQRGYTAKAENVASTTSGNPNVAATDLVQGWLKSPGHFKNLSNPAYTHTGIGVTGGMCGMPYYITQIFGTTGDPLIRQQQQSRRRVNQSTPRGGESRTHHDATRSGHTSNASLRSTSQSSCVVDHADALLHDILLRDEQGERGPEILKDYKRAAEFYMQAIKRCKSTNSKNSLVLKKRLEMIIGRAEELKESSSRNVFAQRVNENQVVPPMVTATIIYGVD